METASRSIGMFLDGLPTQIDLDWGVEIILAHGKRSEGHDTAMYSTMTSSSSQNLNILMIEDEDYSKSFRLIGEGVGSSNEREKMESTSTSVTNNEGSSSNDPHLNEPFMNDSEFATQCTNVEEYVYTSKALDSQFARSTLQLDVDISVSGKNTLFLNNGSGDKEPTISMFVDETESLSGKHKSFAVEATLASSSIGDLFYSDGTWAIYFLKSVHTVWWQSAEH